MTMNASRRMQATALTSLLLIALLSQRASAQDAQPAQPNAVEPAVLAEGREVTLTELLAFAEKNSPALDVADKKLGYGRVAREAAEPALLENPFVEMGVGPRFGPGPNDYDYVIRVQQPVQLTGAVSRTRQAAERLDDRGQADLRAAKFEVRRAIEAAYRKAALARRRAEVAARVAEFEAQLLTVAERRFRAGDTGAIEARMAQADAAQARQRALSAEQNVRSARLALAELSGWPAETPPNVVAVSEPPREVPALATLLRDAAQKHPVLLRARAAAVEAEARQELEDSRAWTKPALGVSFQREGSTGDDENYILMGTLALELPFFQRNQSERGKAAVDHDVALAQERAAARSVSVRVARARLELISAQERLALLRQSVTATLEDNLTLLRRGFEAGEISLLDVSVARERFLRAQEVILDAEQDYTDSLFELELSLGTELPVAKGGAQ